VEKVGDGDKKALSGMVEYCKDDVSGLHKLYEYIKPYIKSFLNMSVFTENLTYAPM
jgi:hypothetical protein